MGNMTVDQAVLAFAGFMALLSAALVLMYGTVWLLLTAFVGLNMIQASFTGFCPAAKVAKALGFKSGQAFP
jgi:hypothetical protein